MREPRPDAARATPSAIPPLPGERACRVCGEKAAFHGYKQSRFSHRVYDVYQCPSCHFAFVGDIWADYDNIYDDRYYAGKGADPLIDYAGEIANFNETVRQYEWRGIFDWASSYRHISSATRWLDYGCGTGGLVRYLRARGVEADGFEQGWCRSMLASQQLPVLCAEDFPERAGSYDIITMIEVIEHVADPIAELQRVRALLAPGGLLLLTTGNAKPYRRNVLRWRYLLPDIHISLFEPSALHVALERAGFSPRAGGFRPGWSDIIRFKILKQLRVRTMNPLERCVPWSILTRLIDRVLQLSAQPMGEVSGADARDR